jgi:hypothetical protein
VVGIFNIKRSSQTIVILIGSALVTIGAREGFANPNCVQSFSTLFQTVKNKLFIPSPQVQVCSYESFRCFENVLPILRALRDSGEDLTKARVLYASQLRSWDTHVIVEHKGRIFDADLGSNFEGRYSIPGIIVEKYFAESRLTSNSRILEIPADRYLNQYDESTWPTFQKQLNGTNPRDEDVHRWTINGFLRRLSRTQP